MRIVAVDPGGTTGLAYVETDDLSTFRSLQLDPLPAIRSIELAAEEIDLVVIEDFRISAATVKKTRQYDALYSIGAIRYVCWRRSIDVEMRLPSERVFATNARLKEMGWRNPTEGGHADDAARHLLVTLIRKGLVDMARFLPETH